MNFKNNLLFLRTARNHQNVLGKVENDKSSKGRFRKKFEKKIARRLKVSEKESRLTNLTRN